MTAAAEFLTGLTSADALPRGAGPTGDRIAMTPAKTEFRRCGILHRQIKRAGNVALYELTKSNWRSPAYEVVKIRHHRGYTAWGSTFEASEYLPSNEEWGTAGWSYMTLEPAQAKFRTLRP